MSMVSLFLSCDLRSISCREEKISVVLGSCRLNEGEVEGSDDVLLLLDDDDDDDDEEDDDDVDEKDGGGTRRDWNAALLSAVSIL